MSENSGTRISFEIVQNIIKIREKRGMSQKELAYRVSQHADKNVTEAMVSCWEREVVPLPAAMMPAICKALACSSYELYPHSTHVSDRDIKLLDAFRHLSEREKDIMYYMIHEWKGDRVALLELGLLHCVMPEYTRWYSDMTIIEAYKDGVRTNDPAIDKTMTVNLPYIMKAFKQLDKE